MLFSPAEDANMSSAPLLMARRQAPIWPIAGKSADIRSIPKQSRQCPPKPPRLLLQRLRSPLSKRRPLSHPPHCLPDQHSLRNPHNPLNPSGQTTIRPRPTHGAAAITTRAATVITADAGSRAPTIVYPTVGSITSAFTHTAMISALSKTTKEIMRSQLPTKK